MGEPILAFQDLSAGYQGIVRAAGISLSLNAGGSLGIVGESGSGKSTLLRAITGEAEVLSGQLLYGGRDVASLSPKEKKGLFGREITEIFQNPSASFDPLRTYWRQFKDVLVSQGLWRRKGEENKKMVLAVLAQLGLPQGERLLASRPWELSGGMNQRMAIALALLLKPRLLLCDEPTSALDPVSREHTAEALELLQKSTDAALLVVTHDLRFAKRVCRDLAVLYGGRVVETGPTRLVMEKPIHPYTRRLTGALPQKGGALPKGLPGAPPPFNGDLEKCPFLSRCPKAVPDCAGHKAVLREWTPGRKTACWKVENHE